MEVRDVRILDHDESLFGSRFYSKKPINPASTDPHFKDEKSEAKEAEEELPTGHLCSMFPQKFSALPLFPFSTLINLLSLSNVGLQPQFSQALPFRTQLADNTLGGQFNAPMCDGRPYKRAGHQQEAKPNLDIRLF